MLLAWKQEDKKIPVQVAADTPSL